MILNRTIEHMKKQHWTGAFIERAMAIPGVFIGLLAKKGIRHGMTGPWRHACAMTCPTHRDPGKSDQSNPRKTFCTPLNP